MTLLASSALFLLGCDSLGLGSKPSAEQVEESHAGPGTEETLDSDLSEETRVEEQIESE